MKYKISIPLIIFLASIIIVNGQNGFNGNGTVSCGSSEIMKQFLRADLQHREINKQVEEKLLQHNQTAQRPASPQAVITLPVAVHIIHNNGAENISDAEVLAGIQHLNEAFANTGYYNPADGTNTNIQFCMAQRDPNGNATNGITRDVSAYTVMGGATTYSDDLNVKNINRWNPLCYINIWLVKSVPGSVAGYAYLPSAHGLSVDGILMEAAFFGNSPSNDVVIIHEMGHYLGLYHTFEGGCTNSDCNADGDRVCDTPPDQSTAATSCGVQVNSCSSDINSGFATDQNDLTQDYMDYGNWNCMSVFTQGQASRMNWHIANVRSSLLNCRSCLSPCPSPVTANFTTSSTSVSAGTLVNFTNTSTNGISYKWYINDVLQSTTFNFSNTFSVPGQFNIKLVASGNNNALCDSSAATATVTVTCPVNANFTASTLEIPLGQTISFVNTTTGSPATYSWLVNNVLTSNATDFSNQFNLPGSFTITLQAASALCTTSKSITVNVNSPCSNNFYFEKVFSEPTMQTFAYSNIVAQDGHIFIGGKITRIVNPGSEWAAVFKLTNNGNLLWSKQYKGTIRTFFKKIIQTADGNFAAVGATYFGSLDARVLVVKMDPNGQIIWQNSFSKTGIVYYNADAFTLIETAGNELITGFTLEKSGGINTYLLKLTAAGNIVWSKEVLPAAKCSFTEFAIKNDHLYSTLAYSENFVDKAGLVKLNISNAGIVYAKKYTSSEVPVQEIDFRNLSFINNEIRAYGLMRLSNSSVDTGSHILVKLDTFGTVQSLNRVRLTDISLSNTFPLHGEFGTVLRDGEYAFCESIYLGVNSSKMFFHQNNLSNTSPSTLMLPSTNRAAMGIVEGRNNNILTMSVKVPAGSGFYKDLSIYSTPKTGIIAPNCGPLTSTYANYGNSIVVNNFPEFALADAAFTMAAPNIYDSTVLFNSENVCVDNTGSLCYAVALDVPDTLCITQDSVLIYCHPNTGCTERISWSVSAPAQNSFRQVNDTTIKVLFSAYGNYSIVASLSSCSAVNDTAKIFVAKNASMLSLGSDKALCNFSTSVLNAGAGYKSYQWYDGSADSTNTVYTAGTYYVTVKDFCNNTNSDTINFVVTTAPGFNIGNDTILCSTDTLSITAPAGFSNYYWAPHYNISATNGQTVKVWPSTDSIYTVTAVFNNNCIVLDSIKITVKDAVPVNLGNDTSLCQGDSLHLNAGAGFSSYQWNTGAVSHDITVSTIGAYFVAAINSSGCISKDTLRVISIYTKPSVNLGIDTSICQNKSIRLHAGIGFSNYNWQDNSGEEYFDTDTTGIYWVKVTNSNGCINSDSIIIKNIIDTASNFILSSIGICSNNKNFIKPLSTYNSYLWSTGSRSDSVLITQPGNYWLQVSNSFGCTGKENFTIVDSVCTKGIYFPNAFTPNNDITNPTFKAIVYDEVNYFKLEIYNRFGQKLFESNDLYKGWDGTFKGVKQDIGTYTWVCVYKFNTGFSKTQKGTVLLLR